MNNSTFFSKIKTLQDQRKKLDKHYYFNEETRIRSKVKCFGNKRDSEGGRWDLVNG